MANPKGYLTEFKVGIFVMIGCAILVMMSLKVGKFKFFGAGATYDVAVLFDNTEGLDKNGSVQISGVPVGRVKEIGLKDNKAKVVLELGNDIQLKKDAVATIKTKGVLGEKFVEIEPGTSSELIPKKDGVIENVKPSMDLDKLIANVDSVMGDIKKVSFNLSDTLGGDEGSKMLKGIFANIYELSHNLNLMVKKNNEGITNTVNNFEKFSRVLAEKTPELSDDLREVSRSLREILNENRGNIRDSFDNIKLASAKLDRTLVSINSVADKIDKGEGTIGKLLNDDSAYENLNKTLTGLNKAMSRSDSWKTSFDFTTEYLFKARDTRTQANLILQPKSDYFYVIGGVSSPYGKVTRKVETYTVNGIPYGKIETETENKKTMKFNAQVGRRFNDLEVRAGIFESTGGIGASYYTRNDTLKYNFEAFDFDRKNGSNVRAGVTYKPLKYLYVSAGVDSIKNKTRKASPYIGAGIKFEDDDIKYLLSSAPLPIK